MKTLFNKKTILGFKVQLNVIKGLYYRELITRISKVRLGLVGILIEPLGLIMIWLLIFGYRRGFKPIYELDLVIFLTAGNIIFRIFSSICNRSLNAIEANKALFYYARVKPIDTLIARSLVEANCYGLIYIIIILLYSFIQNIFIMNNLILISISYLCIILLGLGIGIILMVAAHRFNIINTIIKIILRPLYFISGVFFPFAALPEWIKPLLIWNPILHAIEITRMGFSEKYLIDPSISINYLIKSTIIIITMGLLIYIKNERILLTR